MPERGKVEGCSHGPPYTCNYLRN